MTTKLAPEKNNYSEVFKESIMMSKTRLRCKIYNIKQKNLSYVRLKSKGNELEDAHAHAQAIIIGEQITK